MKRLLFALCFLILCLNSSEIKIGSENAYKPFAYLDEKGKATGFDNDLARLVISYIPNASANFVSVSWNAIFQGLESARFDLIANQITKNEQRLQKYIFSKYPYFYGLSTLIVGENSKASSFEGLKKIGVTVGSNHANNLESYLKKHPNLKIEIVYYKSSPALVADLANGRIEAMINDPVAALDYGKAQGLNLKITSVNLQETPVFFVFRKDSKKLAHEFDKALYKAIKDGKVIELVRSYFGDAYAKIVQKEFDKIKGEN